MRVMVDLDPRDVWMIQSRAEATGRTPGQVLRDQLDRARVTVTRNVMVRGLVLAGMCDADIAAELNETNQTIAAIRRGEGLPANRRYGRKATAWPALPRCGE